MPQSINGERFVYLKIYSSPKQKRRRKWSRVTAKHLKSCCLHLGHFLKELDYSWNP